MAKGSYYFKPRKKSGSTGRFGRVVIRILDILFWTASVVVTTSLIMAVLARYINPEGEIGKVFAFAALIFPILFCCEAIVALYWIVRWKCMAIATLILLLLCLPDAGLFYKPSWGKQYEQDSVQKQGIVVMSYNTMGFGYTGWAQNKLRSMASQIAAYISSQKIDILCAQEFLVKEGVTQNYFDNLVPELKYNYRMPYSNPGGTDGIGLAIYSRFPIVESGVVDIQGEHRRSIWCDIKIGNDTIRIFSNHLQNTNLTASDQDYMEQSVFKDQQIGVGRVKSIVSRLGEAYGLRAPQADSVANAIKGSPYPVVVCGDFNDTPLSYTYHRVSKGLKDSYVAKGRGAMGTYQGFFNMFRIDYILYSQTLEAVSFEVSAIELSDHNPIITELMIND